METSDAKHHRGGEMTNVISTQRFSDDGVYRGWEQSFLLRLSLWSNWWKMKFPVEPESMTACTETESSGVIICTDVRAIIGGS